MGWVNRKTSSMFEPCPQRQGSGRVDSAYDTPDGQEPCTECGAHGYVRK
jgi:DnaJ-class molecular chaperone